MKFEGGGDIKGVDLAKGALAGGAFALNPYVGFIPGLGTLSAILSMGEQENTVKVVSSPRTVVLNRETANIVQSEPVVVQSTTNVAGVVTTEPKALQANVSLQVKPTVTNDGGVMMELNIRRDVPQDQAVANRSITTKVLVQSGSTLVIGGIYTSRTNKGSKGFPLLRKIPILGILFGNDNKEEQRSEIFIFITPRILNERPTTSVAAG
jgi:type IV pilus assembly protein PilQ